MNDISGVSDIDRGRTRESKVTSGVAVQALQEKNQARMNPLAKSIKNRVAQAGMFAMELLQEFSVDERLLPIIGENNRTELIMFNRHSITPQSMDQTQTRSAMVRVDTAGGLPASRTEMLNLIDSLAQRGFLRPGEHDAVVMKALSIGEITEITDKDRVDTASETNAIETFRNGQIPEPPRDVADFTQRFETLSRWVNNDEYVNIVRQHPQIHQPVMERLQYFKQGLVDQQVEVAYLRQMADLRMRNKYMQIAIAAAKRGEIDPSFIETFQIPLGMQAGQKENEEADKQKAKGKAKPKASGKAA